MASKDPFNIANSPSVAPIPCVECGNNMHCVRRQLLAPGEYQLFQCVSCGANTDRTVGLQISDTAIEEQAKTLTDRRWRNGWE